MKIQSIELVRPPNEAHFAFHKGVQTKVEKYSAATLGIDILMLGARHRRTLVSLLKANVVTEVAAKLPDNIQLVIHG